MKSNSKIKMKDQLQLSKIYKVKIAMYDTVHRTNPLFNLQVHQQV